MEWWQIVLIFIAVVFSLRWIMLGIVEELEDRGWRPPS
jgi:hypothetical protein